jgi:hypothetical protein
MCMRLRPLIGTAAFLSLTSTLGCSEPSESEASSAHDLSSVVNGIHLYEQAPPVARLGQALTSVRGEDDRWSAATPLDQMHEMGSSSLGMTVTTVAGFVLDGSGVGLTTVPSSPFAFVTNLKEEPPYAAPTFHFEDIARFQSELAPSSTRVRASPRAGSSTTPFNS